MPKSAHHDKTSHTDHESEHPFGVRYSWSMRDGTICHGSSVAFGRDRAHAERRFFNQNTHVYAAPESDAGGFSDTTDYGQPERVEAKQANENV